MEKQSVVTGFVVAVLDRDTEGPVLLRELRKRVLRIHPLFCHSVGMTEPLISLKQYDFDN
jgi:hypothetical protein